MIGTKHSKSELNQTKQTNGASSARLVKFCLLLAAALTLFVWMEASTWRKVRQLEHTFAEAQPTTFLVGIQMREGMERLTASLLRFELSDDEDERNKFNQVARDLNVRLQQAKTNLLTSEERILATNSHVALTAFVTSAKPMLEVGLRGIRKNTAAEVHEEIQQIAAPVYALADELAMTQEKVAKGFFASAEGALNALQYWLIVSVMFLLGLLGGITVLAYRSFITPLRTKLDETQAVMERQERLASLGVLAAGVAHEIRNPLAAIKFRLFSLNKALPKDFNDKEDLQVIEDELQRLERIVKEFLLFARPAEPQLAQVAVGSLLQGVYDLLQVELHRRGVQSELQPGTDLKVRADRQQLQQVLINLVQNAADAAGVNGRVTLSARQGVATLDHSSVPVVMIEITDTGKGISPEIQKRIFDPFFSTKEGGTGLGLPIAARILERHGGHIQYSTEPDRGTTFSIVLPRLTTNDNDNQNPAH